MWDVEINKNYGSWWHAERKILTCLAVCSVDKIIYTQKQVIIIFLPQNEERKKKKKTNRM